MQEQTETQLPEKGSMADKIIEISGWLEKGFTEVHRPGDTVPVLICLDGAKREVIKLNHRLMANLASNNGNLKDFSYILDDTSRLPDYNIDLLVEGLTLHGNVNAIKIDGKPTAGHINMLPGEIKQHQIEYALIKTEFLPTPVSDLYVCKRTRRNTKGDLLEVAAVVSKDVAQRLVVRPEAP